MNKKLTSLISLLTLLITAICTYGQQNVGSLSFPVDSSVEGRIIHSIKITGNHRTREKAVLRELDLQPGQKFSRSRLIESERRIRALNFIKGVKTHALPGKDSTIDVTIEIAEKTLLDDFPVGLEYDPVIGSVGRLSLGSNNLRGMGEELKLNARLGIIGRSLDLWYWEPWLLGLHTSVSGKLFYNWSVPFDPLDNDTMQSRGIEIGIGRPRLSWPDKYFSINAVYRFSYEMSEFKSNFISNIVKAPRDGFLSRLSLGIMRDDLDRPLFPNSGSKLLITPQIACGFGDIDFFQYFKGTFEYDGYFPLFPRLVLGSITKAGWISSLGGSPIRISRNDLFKIGGIYGDADLRGYSEYSIGGFFGNPEDGLSLLATSISLRGTIIERRIYLYLFADAGNTWSGLSKIDLGVLYNGAGFGTSFNIPVLGKLDVDLGWPVGTVSGKPGGMLVHACLAKN